MPSTPMLNLLDMHNLLSRFVATSATALVAFVVLLAVSITPALSAEETPTPTPLAKLHARVERAFSRCDAAQLRPILSRKVKMLVATRSLAPSDGYYGADQLLILFERLFEGRTTIGFKALSTDPKTRRDGRANLPIRWISSDSGESRSELSLTLILAKEGTDWQIREIRDLK